MTPSRQLQHQHAQSLTHLRTLVDGLPLVPTYDTTRRKFVLATPHGVELFAARFEAVVAYIWGYRIGVDGPAAGRMRWPDGPDGPGRPPLPVGGRRRTA